MGIRRKIRLGLVAIGFILLLSGVVAIFEMTRLTDLISGLLTNNINTISASNTIEQAVIKQNRAIFNITQDELYLHQFDFVGDTAAMSKQVDFIANNITVDGEEPLVDELRKEYQAYTALLSNASSATNLPKEQRIVWYLEYEKSFVSLIGITSEITALNQDALLENAVKLEGNYYRMIMPAIIAIIAGVFMILFFNYFLNSYFVNPVVKIKESIKAFLSSRSPYNVKVTTSDEINELNEAVKDLTDLLKRREKECNSIQNESREA